MARTYLVFGDIEGKLDVLRVECTKCDRKALQRGAATTTEERVIAGKKPMDVTRVRITDAGRRALSGGNG